MEISVSLQFHLQSIPYQWTVFVSMFLTFCTHKNKNNKYSNWGENLEKRNNANQLLIDLWKGIDGSMQNSNTTKLCDDLTFTWKNPNRLKLKLKWLKFTRNFNYLACSHNQYHVNIVGRNGSCKGFFFVHNTLIWCFLPVSTVVGMISGGQPFSQKCSFLAVYCYYISKVNFGL